MKRIFDKDVVFNGTKCWLMQSQYQVNDRISLLLYNAESIKEVGCTYDQGTVVIAKCTLNLTEFDINDDEAFIKDYSENKGMLKTLIEAGIVSEPIKFVKYEHVKIPLCKVLIEIPWIKK